MKLSDEEKRTIEYQFDSFCKKVLREESRSIKRKIQREENLYSNAIANLNREDLFESKKSEFIKKLKIFREKYNV